MFRKSAFTSFSVLAEHVLTVERCLAAASQTDGFKTGNKRVRIMFKKKKK